MQSVLRRLKSAFPHRHPLRLWWHRCKAFAAAVRYGFPARRLTVIGITGTDGKTTTVGMTAHILHEQGIAVGALSTAFFRIKDAVTWNATQKTSPSPFVVQQFLRSAADAGCTHVILECSSHGLVQGRVAWTWPVVAGITNTSPEHLDYHGTMRQYREDKGILFRMLKGKGTKVLNWLDGTYEMYRAIPSARTISYAREVKNDADLRLSGIRTAPSGTRATLHVKEGKHESTHDLSLIIAGDFNMENALCAIGCAMGAGIDPANAAHALASFRGVPGRIERIDEGQPFAVFIDFTVTPASYERTLSTVKTMLAPGERLLVLTGSCGDRMREKRPVIGKICSELADVVVVSNEDPYTEDPEKIIDEVLAGADRTKADIHRIVDRAKAIHFLFSHAKAGDIVVLCGKGSDTTMMTREGQVPWNEREVVSMLLRELQGSK